MFSLISASFDRELAAGVEAPRVARGLLTEWFSSVRTDGTLGTARLLVSELVTNAVCHGRGRVALKARLFDRRLLVEVLDEGAGFEPDLWEGRVRPPGAGRWGLSIVDSGAGCWGLDRERLDGLFEA